MSEETSEIGINGMAHHFTVSQFDRARLLFSLLPKFGMVCVNDGPDFCYHVGARTAIGVRRCDPEFEDERFKQYRVGLHHLCLRGRSREDIDKTAVLAAELGATIIRGPEERDWAKGYYYVLFEDPDGIRFEVSFIPGKGLLKKGESFGSESVISALGEKTLIKQLATKSLQRWRKLASEITLD